MGVLDDKVALVTGAASGIGRATARRLAAAGARVCAVDRDEVGGRAVAEELGGVFVVADAGDRIDVDAAFAACESELGGVDIAHLNAGIAIGVADLTALDDADYERIRRVNLDGVVYGVRAAIPPLRRRGGGAIVATSSLAGLVPFPPDPVYDATKHAVVGLVRSLAPTLAALDITVNCVNPGMTDTNILSSDVKELFRQLDFPLMSADQIAEAVLTIVTTGRTGECWVCQPGRDPEPYRFHEVPGPRTEGATGKRPPVVTPQDGITSAD